MSGSRDQPTELQRALMDRARLNMERDGEKHPRPIWPRIVGAVIAVGIVLALMTGFSKFLTSVQKVLELTVEEEPAVTSEPMPVYSVPESQPVAGPESADRPRAQEQVVEPASGPAE